MKSKKAQLDFMVFLITMLIVIAILVYGSDYLKNKSEIGKVQVSIIDAYYIGEQTREYIKLAAKYSCENNDFQVTFEEFLNNYPKKISTPYASFDISIPECKYTGKGCQFKGKINIFTKVEYTSINYSLNPGVVSC